MADQQSSVTAEGNQQQELEKRITRAAKENRIPCASALAIARSLNISPAEIGEIANRLNIKIIKCQLGCF